MIIVISCYNAFIFNKLYFGDLNPDFNHFIYQCSSCQLNTYTSPLVPKAWVRVDRTLGCSNSCWIEIGSCLCRQIPQWCREPVLEHEEKCIFVENNLIVYMIVVCSVFRSVK